MVGAARRTGPLGQASPGERAEIERLVAPGATMTPVDRLDVYREQYWYRHWANLAEDFPTVSWLLGGRAQLDALSTAFLDASPPTTWNLQRLGEGLPDFVATQAPWRDDRRLLDAARLDWAYVRAFDAADPPAFDAGQLAAMPAEALPLARVTFQAALTLLRLDHAVHATRRAVVEGESPGTPAPVSTCLAVWRDGSHRLHDVVVDVDAFALLEWLAASRPLGEACEQLAAGLAPEAAARLEPKIGDWFQEWTARGWIARVG
jgi:hypothetical protein